MNLENIVPPLELCKQIPAGKFADSVLVWKKYVNFEKKHAYYIDAREWAIHGIPAPTLAEIMEELDNAGWYCPTCYYQAGTWQVDCESDSEENCPEIFCAEDHDTPATAALKLWMELNKENKEKT